MSFLVGVSRDSVELTGFPGSGVYYIASGVGEWWEMGIIHYTSSSMCINYTFLSNDASLLI